MLFRFMLTILIVIKDCISGEMFTLVTNFFQSATKFFLTRIKTYSYGPVTIVGEGAFSRIIPQGILEIICFWVASES